MKNIFLITDDNRVPGVIPALVTYGDITVFGKNIDQLPLSLIPPL